VGTNERHLRAWRMDPQNKVIVMCVTAASPLPRVRDRRGRCTGSGVASSRRAIRRLVEAAAWRDDSTGLGVRASSRGRLPPAAVAGDRRGDCAGSGVRPGEAGFVLARAQAIGAAATRSQA
jgi:hypothetical protein